MMLYGIWCKDANRGKGDWLREFHSDTPPYNQPPILAYDSKRKAQQRAAREYGKSYTTARRQDWCEVRPL